MSSRNGIKRSFKNFNQPLPISIMKKHQRKASRANYNLRDLILAVSSCTKSNRETIAAVADLLDSGKVRLQSGGRKFRARVF